MEALGNQLVTMIERCLVFVDARHAVTTADRSANLQCQIGALGAWVGARSLGAQSL
jgi:hypothetical protein